MMLPGHMLNTTAEWGVAGFGASVGFFFVRWVAVFAAGRWDRKEAQLDAATKLLIEQLQTQVSGLIERLVQVEDDLLACKRMHAESEAQRLRVEAILQGYGDAKQEAQRIIAADKRKDAE